MIVLDDFDVGHLGGRPGLHGSAQHLHGTAAVPLHDWLQSRALCLGQGRVEVQAGRVTCVEQRRTWEEGSDYDIETSDTPLSQVPESMRTSSGLAHQPWSIFIKF